MKNKFNIFIVDDNKVFSLALKADIETTFKNTPIKIRSFETGEKCMEMFPKVMPDLVILDYHLNTKYPLAVDGIKVLDLIKNKCITTHVLMLTSDDHIDIALKSFKHGASDYVVKTETQFKKINISIKNILKLMEASNGARKYKILLFALFLLIGTLIGGVIAIQLFGTYKLFTP